MKYLVLASLAMFTGCGHNGALSTTQQTQQNWHHNYVTSLSGEKVAVDSLVKNSKTAQEVWFNLTGATNDSTVEVTLKNCINAGRQLNCDNSTIYKTTIQLTREGDRYTGKLPKTLPIFDAGMNSSRSLYVQRVTVKVNGEALKFNVKSPYADALHNIPDTQEDYFQIQISEASE